MLMTYSGTYAVYSTARARKTLREAGITERLPRRGQQLLVNFPGGQVLRVTQSPERSTWGGVLYRFQFADMQEAR